MSRKKMEPKKILKDQFEPRYEPRYKQETEGKSAPKKKNLDSQKRKSKIQEKRSRDVNAETQHPISANETTIINNMQLSIHQTREEIQRVEIVNRKIERANTLLGSCLLLIFTYLSILGILTAFIFGPRFLWNIEAETISAQITGHKVSLRSTQFSAIIVGNIFVDFPVQGTMLEVFKGEIFKTDIECTKCLNSTYPINTPIRLYYSLSDPTDIRIHKNDMRWDIGWITFFTKLFMIPFLLICIFICI